MPRKLVAVAGVEPASLDYQSSALSLSYTAMVDPAGLKPAPHSLKGCRSVTRAPDQEMAVAEGLEPSHGRINSAVPYQLGYATKYFGCGGESRTRINSFTRRVLWIQLSYTAILVDREGFKPSHGVCRTPMLSVTSPAHNFGGCGWLRTTNLALMRRTLFPFELHSRLKFGSPRRN